MLRKILFIINPRSGKKNSEEVIKIIKANVPKGLIYQIGLWNTINEFNLLSEKLIQENFTDAIAVGGDGSVNLLGKTVLKTSLVLGIIPTGSGNGLARSLGISINTKEALAQILQNKTALIDNGTVNGTPFFCTSGIGFDAHIGNLFATAKKRGLQSYVKMIVKEFFSYQTQNYVLKINSKEIKREAFLITIANAGQYGNDFYIAPQAKLNDGLFHVVILKPFSLLQGIGTVIKIVRGKANESKFIETFTCSELSIKRQKADSIHYDGEPETQGMELNYINHPKALKVIVGTKFDG